jgi:hypothetical protein
MSSVASGPEQPRRLAQLPAAYYQIVTQQRGKKLDVGSSLLTHITATVNASLCAPMKSSGKA